VTRPGKLIAVSLGTAAMAACAGAPAALSASARHPLARAVSHARAPNHRRAGSRLRSRPGTHVETRAHTPRRRRHALTGSSTSSSGFDSGNAAAVAAVLASTCANTELVPAPGNGELIRDAVLCLINRERAQNGQSPLRASRRLEEAAEGHCAELVADDYFAHVSPTGETPVQRIGDTGYIPGPSVGYVIGENLAWGTYGLATPQSTVAAWVASPGHLANILEAKYTETGIGVTAAVPPSLAHGAPGATYAQEFGVIVR